MRVQLQEFYDGRSLEAASTRRPTNRPSIAEVCPLRLQRTAGKAIDALTDDRATRLKRVVT